MLRAGHEGAFAPLVALVTNADGTFNNHMFFWLAGSLSSFLDNAPTYLAFFNLAGGDPMLLMNEDSHTLMAISMGSVFMGSMTYIGNAPAELHDDLDRSRTRREDAELLRLHDLVRGYLGADVLLDEFVLHLIKFG